MKQFSLKEYLANPSRKVITIDGRNVRIVCTDIKSEFYPILAVVYNGNEEFAYRYTKDGEFFLNNVYPCDLFFESEKYEGWINLLKDLNGDAFVGSPIIYETKENAEKDGKERSTYIATVKIEWEE